MLLDGFWLAQRPEGKSMAVYGRFGPVRLNGERPRLLVDRELARKELGIKHNGPVSCAAHFCQPTAMENFFDDAAFRLRKLGKAFVVAREGQALKMACAQLT